MHTQHSQSQHPKASALVMPERPKVRSDEDVALSFPKPRPSHGGPDDPPIRPPEPPKQVRTSEFDSRNEIFIEHELIKDSHLNFAPEKIVPRDFIAANRNKNTEVSPAKGGYLVHINGPMQHESGETLVIKTRFGEEQYKGTLAQSINLLRGDTCHLWLGDNKGINTVSIARELASFAVAEIPPH